MTHAALLNEPESAPWPRGVLASYADVTPQRSDDFATKNKITLRDFFLVLAGCLGMYGTQLATQYGTRSDIRDLGTKFDAYVQQQDRALTSMQVQINEWRAETKLNRERTSDQDKALSELRGFLVGAGLIKGTK